MHAADLKNIFKKFFKKSPNASSKPHFGADPAEDWKKIIITFFILNLLILGGSGYLFWEINNGNIFEVAPPPSSVADKATRDNLKKIMTIYDNREKQFEELRTAKPVTQDPSI